MAKKVGPGPDKLAIRVRGVNRANDAGNKLYAQLAPIFKPLVGQKILKADGSFLKTVEKLIPKFDWDHKLNVVPNRRDYNLSWEVKTWEGEPSPIPNHSDIGFYHSTYVYIGSMSNGVLNNLADPPNFKTDYDAKTIAETRVAYKAAQEAADKLKSKLFPFDEYDR